MRKEAEHGLVGGAWWISGRHPGQSILIKKNYRAWYRYHARQEWYHAQFFMHKEHD